MTRFLHILRFECRYHLRRPTLWVLTALFFSIALADVIANATAGRAFFYLNSPSQIYQTTIWYTIFGILAASALVAETFVRDVTYRMEALILSTPIRKRDYLGARFLAALGMTLLAFSAYLPGMLLGTLVPGLNPFAIGPFRPDAYLTSYVVFVLPNVLVAAALVFALASRTRSMVMTYVGAIGLIMLYVASLMMIGVEVMNVAAYRLWAMIDPFGFYAYQEPMLSWTVHQHNTLVPPLSGTLLWNRLIWLGIAAGLWTWHYRAHAMAERAPLRPVAPAAVFAPTDTEQQAALPPAAPAAPCAQPLPARTWGAITWWRQWWWRSAFETRLILKGRAFALLTIGGLISLVLTSLGSRSFHYSYPSTDLLIHAANIYFEYILFAIIMVYAAELMWRDRDLRLQDIIDATPVSNSVLLLSKLTALFAIITLNLLLAMLVMVGYQAFQGYGDFEIPLYLQMLFVEHGPYFYLTAMMALFTQVITRHKYAGMALAVLIALTPIPLDALGLFHNLYRFAQTNDIDYSLMNGYGHLFTGHLWYTVYWALAGAVWMVLAHILWPRGMVHQGVFRSWHLAWRRSPGRVKVAFALCMLMCAGTGGWIYYHTAILNAYQPPGKEETAAEIEKRFKRYEHLPMPVVTETKLHVELYPQARYFVAQGSYVVENRTQTPIHELHLLTFINLHLQAMTYPGATLREAHPKWGYYIYDLATPLLPGERQTLQFTTRTQQPRGFRNQVDSDDVYMIYPNDVVGNGTNLYSPFILPFIGYTKMVEHKKAWLRHQWGLPPLEQRMRRHDDPVGRSQSMMATHLGWGHTDITIGTSGDQTAVTTGRLVAQWETGDRRYFRYQSTAPGRGKFTIYSGRYHIHRKSTSNVSIDIYHHPQHPHNVELIARHLSEALAFYERTFGPYPFPYVRVVEFVYYDGMVFSDGGVIGIPETLVWKNDVRGAGQDDLIDWVTYLLAHAWWEDQLIAADVAGSMTIREALSAYASTLYQRSRRTVDAQRLAKQRLLRDFFRQLGKIDFQEPPLVDIYNELPIARHKGGMVLELIEDLIGRAALHHGIRDFLSAYRYQPPPYATVLDLRDRIAAQAAPVNREIIQELFDRVITFDVGLLEADYQPLANGTFRVRLRVEARKLYTRGLGMQDAAAVDLPLTIALWNHDGDVIYLNKHPMRAPQTEIELITSERPARAAVDPNYALLSMFPQKHVKRLRAAPKRQQTPQGTG